ncbi:Protein N-acetyltransferase, RimJ/RimL family [Kaistia soli DSM 19436]|uniref:Protein N-acetyltransferase, RimJ/RimL family n=1 Tax=Kaistia soli DSM 19436 TaxID=1122133 RepID=A0A1M4UYN2_9HYPH|nr:GNAT family protein [Kaistia soli]SHE61733.1 Protein N-acetyltransferase, RimJ/RimL family [Kaistia soli DSM 19436]
MDGLVGSLDVTRARLEDLTFVMATERIEAYAELVGRSSEAQHRAFMVDDRHAYFIGRLEGRPIGFVIIRDWQSWDGVALVKRIVVTEPGHGWGGALLARAVDRVFEDTTCHRLAIGLFPENDRARRTYERVGFRNEGTARGAVFFKGEHRDELVMAMLRPDWEAIRQEKG